MSEGGIIQAMCKHRVSISYQIIEGLWTTDVQLHASGRKGEKACKRVTI